MLRTAAYRFIGEAGPCGAPCSGARRAGEGALAPAPAASRNSPTWCVFSARRQRSLQAAGDALTLALALPRAVPPPPPLRAVGAEQEGDTTIPRITQYIKTTGLSKVSLHRQRAGAGARGWRRPAAPLAGLPCLARLWCALRLRPCLPRSAIHMQREQRTHLAAAPPRPLAATMPPVAPPPAVFGWTPAPQTTQWPVNLTR